jgi:hypothetical protein
MGEAPPLILGGPGPELARSLANVLAGAQRAGAPSTELIVVQGADDEWLHQLLQQPSERRLRGVVVARNEHGLAAAVRAGIGGALWSPPATSAMAAALEAAAAAEKASHGEMLSIEDAAALVGGSAEAWAVVRVAGQELWLGRSGLTALRHALAGVGRTLGTAYLLNVGAALLLPADRAEDASAAWLKSQSEGAAPGGSRLVSTGIPVSANEMMIFEAVGGGRPAGPGRGRQRPEILEPVYEIPSGRRVGWWSPSSREEAAPDGWLAVPETAEGAVCCWHLEGGAEGPAKVPEIVCTGEVPVMGEAAAARVPGWVAADLRPATPAGLLVERLARATEKAGMPLWVPNVTTEGLRFLLGVGAAMWVDGPAVPVGDEPQ